jgi:hypothetical protein
MAGLNVNKWQAARRKTPYSPVMQFYLRQIRTALDKAKAIAPVPCPYSQGWYPDGQSIEYGIKPGTSVDAHWDAWDCAVMARDWIARATPDKESDHPGYILSFEHACEVLGLNADYEAEWMLREIDECGDFDTDEVYARIEFLTVNPPDEVEEELFEAIRVVPKLDQGNLFGNMEAA